MHEKLMILMVELSSRHIGNTLLNLEAYCKLMDFGLVMTL